MITTAESCRFVLRTAPRARRWPIINRLTDKQAIALIHRVEGEDRGIAMSKTEKSVQRTLINCSPDRAIFP